MSAERERDRPEQAEEPVQPAVAAAEAQAVPMAGMSNASEYVQRLAHADLGTRAQALGNLQRSVGNAALGQMLTTPPPAPASESSEPGGMQTITETRSYRFQASIPRAVRPAPAPAPPAIAGVMMDSEPGSEKHPKPEEILQLAPAGLPQSEAAPGPVDPAAAPAGGEAAPASGGEGAGAQAAAPAEEAGAAPAEAGAGAEVRLGTIEVPGLAQLEMSDSLMSLMVYGSTITRGGSAGAGNFGITNFGDLKIKDVAVTPMFGTFTVVGEISHKIVWQVRSGTGPGGQVSVGSETSPLIKKSNFAQVASDITPNMSDLGGRPPRTKFWSQDLTERHELFHATDVQGRGQTAVFVATHWLDTQTASTVADVNLLLKQVPVRAVAALVAGMGVPAEHRAYGDGAPAYKTRADAITAKGAAGDYK